MADTCSDACGWTAALASLFADGTGSVPIKCERARRVDIDPLVFETYKRATYFVLSWTVLLLGEKLTFTPWGIVSGIMLVPGGMCGVYAVKNAGLAVSQGIWSSLKVLVSFIWGMFIFDELVKSRTGACFAIFLIAVGLVGMSYFSSPEVIAGTAEEVEHGQQQQQQGQRTQTSSNEDWEVQGLEGGVDSTLDQELPRESSMSDRNASSSIENNDNDLSTPFLSTTGGTAVSSSSKKGQQQNHFRRPLVSIVSSSEQDNDDDAVVVQCTLTKRQLGLLCAVFDGIWGGSFLVPLHFSKYQGLGFVISEAFGAMIVVILCWVFRLGYNTVRSRQSIRKSYDSLPSMHFKTFWLPGILAGSLSSIGNIGAVLATTALGYSVGYPISHSSLLVSGLFGIFVYKEVRGTRNVVLWFSAALVTFSGMIFLSRMHEKKST